MTLKLDLQAWRITVCFKQTWLHTLIWEEISIHLFLLPGWWHGFPVPVRIKELCLRNTQGISLHSVLSKLLKGGKATAEEPCSATQAWKLRVRAFKQTCWTTYMGTLWKQDTSLGAPNSIIPFRQRDGWRTYNHRQSVPQITNGTKDHVSCLQPFIKIHRLGRHKILLSKDFKFKAFLTHVLPYYWNFSLKMS